MKKSNISHKKRFIGNSIFFMVSTFFTLSSHNPSRAQSGQYKYSIPTRLNDGWEVASLQDVGIDAEAIEALTRQILTEDRFESLLSMLIVKDGKLVHEAYSPYVQRNTLHWMASITKTFTSTLIGIAIDQDFIRNVHTSVQDLLPDYADAIKDPDFKTITLRHLMTMSSGLDWMERVSYNDPRNSEHQMVDSEDWIRFVLSHQVQDTPGTRFLYNTGGMHLLSAVIKSVTGLYANEFAEKYLLHPMGIRAYQWNRDIMGYPCTGGTDGGLGLRTRDIAKFGWLVLRDGKWKGKQIISSKWIKEATDKPNGFRRGSGYYSYNWSSGFRRVSSIKFDYIASFGYGGQTLYIVPEYDLILVFTCELAEGNANVHTAIQKTFKAIIHE